MTTSLVRARGDSKPLPMHRRHPGLCKALQYRRLVTSDRHLSCQLALPFTHKSGWPS